MFVFEKGEVMASLARRRTESEGISIPLILVFVEENSEVNLLINCK